VTLRQASHSIHGLIRCLNLYWKRHRLDHCPCLEDRMREDPCRRPLILSLTSSTKLKAMSENDCDITRPRNTMCMIATRLTRGLSSVKQSITRPLHATVIEIYVFTLWWILLHYYFLSWSSIDLSLGSTSFSEEPRHDDFECLLQPPPPALYPWPTVPPSLPPH
jgi:hypothetical protein